jgi:hypothetical protein
MCFASVYGAVIGVRCGTVSGKVCYVVVTAEGIYGRHRAINGYILLHAGNEISLVVFACGVAFRLHA